MRSCFWDDAIDGHGFMIATPDELVEAAKDMLRHFESTMHFLGNSIVRVDGDKAQAETYCIAYHRIVCDARDYDRVVGMRIVDSLERQRRRVAIHQTDLPLRMGACRSSGCGMEGDPGRHVGGHRPHAPALAPSG